MTPELVAIAKGLLSGRLKEELRELSASQHTEGEVERLLLDAKERRRAAESRVADVRRVIAALDDEIEWSAKKLAGERPPA